MWSCSVLSILLKNTLSTATSSDIVLCAYVGIHWQITHNEELTPICPKYRWVNTVVIINWGPFYLHGPTIIPAWISDYIHNKLCNVITYPLPNFNGAAVIPSCTLLNMWFYHVYTRDSIKVYRITPILNTSAFNTRNTTLKAEDTKDQI